MESRRYLRCLGQPALFAATGEPIRFRTKKHLALLVYLAVEPRRPHMRERLAELLWPTGSRSEARHSLATALSILRPRVGAEVLETDRERVLLLPNAVAMDLDRLAAGDILGSEVIPPLEVAAFLDGFDIPESGEFTLWKDRQQARLLPAIKDALVILIDRCRRTGDSRQIEQLADRMLALDELSEEAIRAKMEARAFAGDRFSALRIFEEWKRKAAEELGAAPSDALEAIATRLRRRGIDRPAPATSSVAPEQSSMRSFIGRSEEYRVLYETWESVRAGGSGHVLILGDAGIGKTTLVNRFLTAAGLEGAAISRVQCYELEREIPYATLSNLIHGILDRPGASATLPEALGELARTVPEVRRRFPSIPPPAASEGETARIRLTEAFQELLVAVGDEHPVILVVDDLHLADDASLSVLHLVLRRSRGQPVMMVLITRPGDLSHSPHAMRLRDGAGTLGLREIEPRPMTEAEAREHLAAIVPPEAQQPGASVRRTLLRAARGFPMILELLVQDWQANGNQCLALTMDAMTVDVGITGPPPAIYRRALDRIADSLDKGTRNVLDLAAILGPRLNELSMYSLVDLSVGQTMNGLGELVNRCVLRDGGNGLEFVNDLVRSAAYMGVPSSLRRQLHSGIADRLVATQVSGGSVAGLEIAWHCIRAARTPEATPYLLEGARVARAQGALHAAERGLSTALRHLQPPVRVDAVILLAEVLQEQGQWAPSLELLEEEVFFGSSDATDARRVLTTMAKANLFGVEPRVIKEELDYLVNLIGSSAPIEIRLLAARVAAFLVGDLRSSQLAEQVLAALTTLQSRSFTTDDLSRLALVKAILLFHRHDRRSSLEEIKIAARNIDAPNLASTTACHLQAGLGAINSLDGHYSEAVSFLLSAYRIALRLDNDTLRSQVAANLALAYGRLGEYRSQCLWASESISLAPLALTSFTQVLAAYCASLGLIMQGQADLGLQQLATIEQRMPGLLPKWARQAWALYSADLLHLAGKGVAARRAALHATVDQDFRLHAPGFAGPFARWVVRLAEQPDGLARAQSTLSPLETRLESFDALDRAEILAAICQLERRLGRQMRRTDELRRCIATLPEAVVTQLTRLGFAPV